MSTVASIDPRIKHIAIDEYLITADLEDGRTISVPLAWSWRLSNATEKERQNFIINPSRTGVHWPDIDEDISASGLLYGIPATPPKHHKGLSA